MDTTFINSENSKTSHPRMLLLSLTGKIDLQRGEKSVAISNRSISYTWKTIKIPYNNNKLKISASTWNEKFKLPDGSYSISDIQDLFKKYMEKILIILQ